MFNKMYLTDSELRHLDMGDVHAIVESMPAYNSLSQKLKTDYFLAMMHVVEGQEINPFEELILIEAVLIWKERKIMNAKLTQWISPELINETFSRMRDCVERLQKLQLDTTKVKVELEQAKAKMGADPDFKWGSNDTVRDAQIAAKYPDIIAKLATVKLEEQKIQDEKELISLTIQQLNMTIDFFKVFEHVSGE